MRVIVYSFCCSELDATLQELLHVPVQKIARNNVTFYEAQLPRSLLRIERDWLQRWLDGYYITDRRGVRERWSSTT